MLVEEAVTSEHSRVRQAVRVARRLTNLLQGTMALENQALDRKTLRVMRHRTVRDLLATNHGADSGR